MVGIARPSIRPAPTWVLYDAAISERSADSNPHGIPQFLSCFVLLSGVGLWFVDTPRLAITRKQIRKTELGTPIRAPLVHDLS